MITGPSTSTTTGVKVAFGQISETGNTVSTASQCLTDSFSVTGSPGSAVPVLCGTLTGDHSKDSFTMDTTGVAQSSQAKTRAVDVEDSFVVCTSPWKLSGEMI